MSDVNIKINNVDSLEQLKEELAEVLNHYILKFDLNAPEVLGIIELLKQDVIIHIDKLNREEEDGEE